MVTFRVVVRRETLGADALFEQVFQLQPGNSIGFGRSMAGNELVISDPRKKISSKHGRLECREDGQLFAIDLDSTNGTFCGDVEVTGDGLCLDDPATLLVGDYALSIERVDDSLAPSGVCGKPVLNQDAAAPGSTDEFAVWAAHHMRCLARALVPGSEVETADQMELFATLLQQFCETSLRWTTRALQGRAAFEQEFGAEVTMVLQRGANPLKRQNAQDMSSYLFDWAGEDDRERRATYLESVFQDLAEHQLGLLAGVREAVGAVVERLAPENIMARCDGGLLGSKAAKAWKTYEEVYRDLVEEKSKLFADVISPAVQRGYLGHHDEADRSSSGDDS